MFTAMRRASSRVSSSLRYPLKPLLNSFGSLASGTSTVKCMPLQRRS
jgi:hypothetical protein